MNTAPQQVFERRAVRRNRERAAPRLHEHDFLLREVGERLVERLDDIRRAFPLALDLGCRTGLLAPLLARRGGIATVLQADLAAGALAGVPGVVLAADEEALPFADASLDLVISSLGLHWVNDLPGALIQIRRALKPDGLFLAAMFGGETLRELRQALGEAELAMTGGVSPRVSPFTDVRVAGNLLQRAGLTLPVVDLETITVAYADPWALLRDLRGMGEANAVMLRRRQPLRRDVLLEAMARYRQNGSLADGRVPATFQVIFMLGWAPDPRQQQPARRGSGRVSLEQVLAPEAAGPDGSGSA